MGGGQCTPNCYIRLPVRFPTRNLLATLGRMTAISYPTPAYAAPTNILILSSDTGGGHRSAASALEESFLSIPGGRRILVEVARVLEEATWLTGRLADLYNHLLRHRQDWMKYYYDLIQYLRPNESRLIFQAALGEAYVTALKMSVAE